MRPTATPLTWKGDVASSRTSRRATSRVSGSKWRSAGSLPVACRISSRRCRWVSSTMGADQSAPNAPDLTRLTMPTVSRPRPQADRARPTVPRHTGGRGKCLWAAGRPGWPSREPNRAVPSARTRKAPATTNRLVRRRRARCCFAPGSPGWARRLSASAQRASSPPGRLSRTSPHFADPSSGRPTAEGATSRLAGGRIGEAAAVRLRLPKCPRRRAAASDCASGSPRPRTRPRSTPSRSGPKPGRCGR